LGIVFCFHRSPAHDAAGAGLREETRSLCETSPVAATMRAAAAMRAASTATVSARTTAPAAAIAAWPSRLVAWGCRPLPYNRRTDPHRLRRMAVAAAVSVAPVHIRRRGVAILIRIRRAATVSRRRRRLRRAYRWTPLELFTIPGAVASRSGAIGLQGRVPRRRFAEASPAAAARWATARQRTQGRCRTASVGLAELPPATLRLRRRLLLSAVKTSTFIR